MTITDSQATTFETTYPSMIVGSQKSTMEDFKTCATCGHPRWCHTRKGSGRYNCFASIYTYNPAHTNITRKVPCECKKYRK